MVIPGILQQDLNIIQEELEIVSDFAPLVQIDLNDGKVFEGESYLNLDKIINLTNREEQENKERQENLHSLQLDIHLMVKDPFPYLRTQRKKIKQISAHAEAPVDLKKWINQAKDMNYQAGVSLAPKTSWKEVTELIEIADFVQFLTVIPGKQGQPFKAGILKEISSFHKKYPQKTIQVDGGIKENNIKQVLQAGANNVVIGSAIVRAKDPLKAYKKFKDIENEYKKAI